MSYTIGIKRKLGPGFKKHTVNTHYYDQDRIFLELSNGGQLSYPGLHSLTIQVYPDIWEHNRLLESRKAEEQAREQAIQIQANRVALERLEHEKKLIEAQQFEAKRLAATQVVAPRRDPQPTEPARGYLPELDDPEPQNFADPLTPDVDTLGQSHVSEEVKQNAAARVRGILQSEEFTPRTQGANAH